MIFYMYEKHKDHSVEMVVKGFPEEHFEDLIEGELAIELDFNVLHDGINVIVTETCTGDKIGPFEFLPVQNTVFIVIDNFKSLNIQFVTAVHYHFSN